MVVANHQSADEAGKAGRQTRKELTAEHMQKEVRLERHGGKGMEMERLKETWRRIHRGAGGAARQLAPGMQVQGAALGTAEPM